MATKNPIGNYGGRMDDIDKQSYFSKELSNGVSRRGFLKLLGGTAAGAVFGEGFLKQMEAWAQSNKSNGVVVYINPICAVEGIEPGKYERIVPTLLKSALSNKRGIKLTTIPDNADFVIDLNLFYVFSDPDIKTAPYESNDSVTMTATYIDREGFEKTQKFAGAHSITFPDRYLEGVANSVAEYIKSKGYDISSENDNSGNQNKNKRKEVGLGPNARKSLEDPKTKDREIKFLKSIGYEVEEREGEIRVFKTN